MDNEITGEPPTQTTGHGSETPAAARAESAKKMWNPALVFLILFFVIFVATVVLYGPLFGRHPATEAARRSVDRSISERLAAIRELEVLGAEDPKVVLPALSKCLRDSDANVRVATAGALVMAIRGAGDRWFARDEVHRAVAGLAYATKDPQPNVRSESLQALWTIGLVGGNANPPVELKGLANALVKAAADPDAGVRLMAVRGLGLVGPRVAEDPPEALTRALEDDSEKVRASAAESLALFPQGLPRVLPALVHAFEKARPECRSGYATVLLRIRPKPFTASVVSPLAAALASPDDEIRYLAANALTGFKDAAYPAVPALVASMGRPARSQNPADAHDPVLAAGRALLQIPKEIHRPSDPALTIDPSSLATLAKVLQSGSPEVRAVVAAVLGRFDPTVPVVPVLVASVRDPDEKVRAAALQSLEAVGNKLNFVPPKAVVEALEDESPNVRYWAAGALGHAGRGLDPYIPALIRHAEHDEGENVRYVCAMEILWSIKPPAVTSAVIPLLSKALESPNGDLRCAACSLLAEFGRESAPVIPAVIRQLRQSTKGGPSAVPSMGANDQTRWAAVALSRIAPGTPQAQDAVVALMETLRSDRLRSPGEVMTALTKFGPLADGAIPRLRELAKVSNKGVSQSALEALKALNAAP
jgi:HEAT repeat protein